MTTADRPPIPLEVLEQIVTEDAVGYSGTVSLLSASTALRHCALRRLFKPLRIPVSDSKAVQKLRDMICVPTETTSRIGGVCTYIKSLEITYEVKKETFPANGDVPAVDGSDDVQGSNPAPSFHDSFEPILDILIKILESSKPFSLSFYVTCRDNTLTTDACSWSNLPKGVQASLQALVRLPSITDLDIRGLASLPVELLQGSHVVRFTQLSCGPFRLYKPLPITSGADAQALSDDIYPALQRLVTDHTYSLLGTRPLFRDLRYLRVVHSVPEQITAFWRLMKYARHTLEELDMSEHSVAGVELKTPSLSRAPNLKKFSYHGYHIADGSLCLHILLLLFNVTSPLNSLHTLFIKLEFARTESMEDAFALIQPPAWIMMGIMLASTNFPVLYKLTVKLNFTLPTRYMVHWPEEDMFGPNARALTMEEFQRMDDIPSLGNMVSPVLTNAFAKLGLTRSSDFSASVGVCYSNR